MIKEVWKDIPNYPNYQVSNYGRVKSLNYRNTKQEKILKVRKGGNNDYLLVTLYKGNSKQYNRLVHRIMVESFNLPNNNPTEKTQVNHINENPEFNFIAVVNNQIISNSIEWITPKENCNYGTCIERKSKTLKGKYKGENNPMYGKHLSEETKQKMRKPRLYQRKPILQYTLEGVFVKEWDSAKSACISLNIDNGNLVNCLKNNTISCNNYLWFYKNTFTEQLLLNKINQLNKPNPKSKPILQYTLSGEFVKEWDSVLSAEKQLGYANDTIGKVCRGKRKSAKGFYWKYKE